MTTTPAKKPAEKPVGSDLAALASELGISFGAGGTVEDPDDPWINVNVRMDQGRTGPLRVADRRRMSDVLNDFYRRKGNDLVQLQAQLYRAGFYSGDVALDDIDFGNHDEDSFNAFKRAVGRAANFAQAGESTSLADILKTVSKPVATGRAGSGGRGSATVLTNPADIVRMVEKIAKDVTGHKLTDDQRQRAVAVWQSQERGYAAGVEGGGTVVKPPDFDTFAENFAKQEDPQGAFRQRAIGVFGELGSILGGGASAAE